MQAMSQLLRPAAVVKEQPWMAEAAPTQQNFIHTVGIPGNTAHNCGSRASGYLRVAFC